MLSRPRVSVLPAIRLVELGIARLNGQLAARRHCVAGVDCEIENCGLEFGLVGFHRPNAGAAHDLQRNILADRALQKIGEAAEQPIDVDDCRIEGLLARKG